MPVRRFPSNVGIKEGYFPKKLLFYRYELVWCAADKLSGATNIDDLECL